MEILTEIQGHCSDCGLSLAGGQGTWGGDQMVAVRDFRRKHEIGGISKGEMKMLGKNSMIVSVDHLS